MGHKKILFISPVGEFYGGGERSGFEFCKFLEKNKYKVITAIPKSSRTYKSILIQTDMEYRLMDCSDFESQIMRGNHAFPRIVSQLMDIIEKDKIDIVVTNLYAQSGPVAAVLSGVPNMSMDRGQAYLGTFFSDFMTEFSDTVVVNSSGLADVYKKTYNIKTPIVYSYTPTPGVGLDSDIKEQRIVCVSRIAPEKNLLEVLKAVKSLKDRGYDKKVLFIGPVPSVVEENYKAELQSYAKENGLEGNVAWLGDQRDPWSLVGEHDIYISTSMKESVGRSNIEAIKLGVPAVIVDIPGHKDIITKIGVSSYPEGKTEVLVEKIQYLIDNYSVAKKEAAKYRKKAETWISEYGCNKAILPVLEAVGGNTGVRSDKIFNHILKELNISEQSNAALREHIASQTAELELKNKEIDSFLGIKRSARLLLGNIKRRFYNTLISKG